MSMLPPGKPSRKDYYKQYYQKNKERWNKGSIQYVCPHCHAEFTGRRGRTYCSNRCRALSRLRDLVEGNESRRKYPKIEGLSKHQIFWRCNDESRDAILDKDRRKRRQVVAALGGKCAVCGYDDVRALVLDHKNGDGDTDRKSVGSKIARYYVAHLDEAAEKLQVLCANCNMIKAFDNNEHNKTRRVAAQTLKKMH